MIKKLIIKLAILGTVILAWTSTSIAALITENLQNATFYDGGVVKGFFMFDTVSRSITNWNIDVSRGDTATFPALIYAAANSTAFAGTSDDLGLPLTAFEFNLNSSKRQLRLLLENSLPLGGGIDPFHIWPNGASQHKDGFECFNCFPFRNFATGSVANVPEPSLVTLVGLSLAVFALKRQK